MQPQSHEFRLHRLAYYPHHLSSEYTEVGLVARRPSEGRQHFGRVVLAPVEAPVDEVWMRRRSGMNSAAIVKVEATIASSEPPTKGAMSVRLTTIQPT